MFRPSEPRQGNDGQGNPPAGLRESYRNSGILNASADSRCNLVFTGNMPPNPCSILIVDDEIPLLETLSAGLRTHGYSVVCANNGKQAIELLRQRSFDIVVTDVLMPEADGLEVLMHVRGMNPKPAVIPMSGGGEMLPRPYALHAAVNLGGQKPLVKPFTLQQLLDAVQSVAGKSA